VIAFNDVDLDNNNELNLQQFTTAIQSLDWLPSEKEIIRDYFHLLDKNDNGILDIDEFLMVIRTMSLEEE
jgi:Ca2+-binding EF-hand superfamily protein